MTTPVEMLSQLADVAREKGLQHVEVNPDAGYFKFTVGPSPKAAPSEATLRPLSVPNTQTDSAMREAKRKQLAAYRDAVECAHINGWPDPADYGLSQQDVA